MKKNILIADDLIRDYTQIYSKHFKIDTLWNNKGKKIIKSLFNLISKKPYKFLAKRKFTRKEKFRVIADFISGMTDRYAINLYNSAK